MHRGARHFEHFRVAALAILLLAGACTNGGDRPTFGTTTTAPRADPTLASIVEATGRAGALGLRGTAVSASGARGPVVGTVAGDGSKGTVTFPAFFGDLTTTVEARWLDGVLYLRREPVPAEKAKANPASFYLVAAPGKPWMAVTLVPVVQLSLAGYDPAAVLQLLRSGKAQLEDRGTTRLGKLEARHFRVQARGLVGGLAGARPQVELWADDDHVLRRLRIAGPAATITYDLNPGARLPTLAPPPPDQVFPNLAARSAPADEQPTGPFEPVASGTSNGVRWTLLRAPAGEGRACWRFDATPAISQAGGVGTGPRCLDAVPAAPAGDDSVRFVVDGDGTGGRDAVAVAVPPGTKRVTLGFEGGRTEDLPLTGGVAVWVGPPTPIAAYIGVTLSDGTALDCGPGWVTTLDDIAGGLSADQRASLRRAPWACLEAET